MQTTLSPEKGPTSAVCWQWPSLLNERVGVESATVRVALAVEARMIFVDAGQTVDLPNVQLGRLGVIAIARAVSGARVAGTGLAAVALHQNETKGRINAASTGRHVHFERQLLVE